MKTSARCAVAVMLVASAAGMARGQYGGAGSGTTQTPPSSPAKPTTTQPSATQPSKPAAVEPGSSKLGDVDLRTKFKAGQQTRYVFEQLSKNQITSTDGGTEMDQKQEQTNRIGMLMKVVESGEAGATIQVVYESIKVSIKSGDEVSEFDSTKPTTKPGGKAPNVPSPAPAPGAKPGSGPAAPAATPDVNTDPLKAIGDLDAGGMLGLIVGPMVGTTITVKTDHNGAITSVSGGEGMGGGLGALGGAGGGIMPSPSQMANWLVAGMGGAGGKSSARVGETWTNSDAMNGTPVGAFTMKTTHTLKSASGGMANLAFQGRVEAPSEAAAPGASAGQVKSASYTGTYVWDTRQGALAEMNTTMSVVMDGGVMGAKGRLSADTVVKVRRQQ